MSTGNGVYSPKRTAWKGLLALLTGAAPIVAIAVIEFLLQEDTVLQLKELMPAGVVAVAIALLAALRNWLKNKDRGKAAKSITYRSMSIVLLAALGLCAVQGCATSSVMAREITPDGSSFLFRQVSFVTIGSKQDEGSGQMVYTGPDWEMAIGGGAVGQVAGDGTEQLRMLLQLAPLLSPLLQSPSPPAPLDGELNLDLLLDKVWE